MSSFFNLKYKGRKNMKMREITFDYDKEADVLYVSFGKPKEAITEERGNMGVRISEKTKEIVGVTIIEFLKTFGKKHAPIRISVPKILRAAGIKAA